VAFDGDTHGLQQPKHSDPNVQDSVAESAGEVSGRQSVASSIKRLPHEKSLTSDQDGRKLTTRGNAQLWKGPVQMRADGPV
jgi:hypothetical protein